MLMVVHQPVHPFNHCITNPIHIPCIFYIYYTAIASGLHSPSQRIDKAMSAEQPDLRQGINCLGDPLKICSNGLPSEICSKPRPHDWS